MAFGKKKIVDDGKRTLRLVTQSRSFAYVEA